jgi:hypothetical protein
MIAANRETQKLLQLLDEADFAELAAASGGDFFSGGG